VSDVNDATVSPAVSDGQCVKYNTSDITDTTTPVNSDGIFPIQNDEPLTSEAGDVCGDSWPDDKDNSMLENVTVDANQSGWHFITLISYILVMAAYLFYEQHYSKFDLGLCIITRSKLFAGGGRLTPILEILSPLQFCFVSRADP